MAKHWWLPLAILCAGAVAVWPLREHLTAAAGEQPPGTLAEAFWQPPRTNGIPPAAGGSGPRRSGQHLPGRRRRPLGRVSHRRGAGELSPGACRHAAGRRAVGVRLPPLLPLSAPRRRADAALPGPVEGLALRDRTGGQAAALHSRSAPLLNLSTAEVPWQSPGAGEK